jgi:hypothetical protein
MKQADGDESACVAVEQQYERRILHDHFVRFHMSLILTAVIASGILASKGLLEFGVHSLRLRYPLAVLGSYLVFLLLVRLWIWYVSIHRAARLGIGNLDLGGTGGGGSSGGVFGFGGSGDSGGGGGGFAGFGGGDSGGGGASTSWENSVAAASVSQPAPGSGSSGWFPKLDFDFDFDDGGWVIILLAVLILAILGGAGYLVWVAPHVLPEAAGQALLATTLTRISREEHHNWMTGVLRSTWIPFTIILILATVLGWEAHRHCPAASRLIDVFHCVVS